MASKVADIARIQQRTLHERAAPKLNRIATCIHHGGRGMQAHVKVSMGKLCRDFFWQKPQRTYMVFFV